MPEAKSNTVTREALAESKICISMAVAWLRQVYAKATDGGIGLYFFVVISGLATTIKSLKKALLLRPFSC